MTTEFIAVNQATGEIRVVDEESPGISLTQDCARANMDAASDGMLYLLLTPCCYFILI